MAPSDCWAHDNFPASQVFLVLLVSSHTMGCKRARRRPVVTLICNSPDPTDLTDCQELSGSSAERRVSVGVALVEPSLSVDLPKVDEQAGSNNFDMVSAIQ